MLSPPILLIQQVRIALLSSCVAYLQGLIMSSLASMAFVGAVGSCQCKSDYQSIRIRCWFEGWNHGCCNSRAWRRPRMQHRFCCSQRPNHLEELSRLVFIIHSHFYRCSLSQLLVPNLTVIVKERYQIRIINPDPLNPWKPVCVFGEVCSLQDAHAIPDCSSDPVGFQTDPHLYSGGLNY